MANDFKYCMKEYPVITFFALSVLFTWTSWVPQLEYIRELFPVNYTLSYVLGSIGPFLAAYVLLVALYGRKQTEEQFAQMLGKWRLPLRWYGVGALLVLLLALPSFLSANEESVPVLLLSFIVSLIGAVAHETAWRGFALPRLQQRFSALYSGLIIGIMSALWDPRFIGGILGVKEHISPVIDLSTAMPVEQLLPWFISIVMSSVIFTWLYNSTKGSVFLVVLVHALANTFGPFLGWPSALMTTAAALLLAAVYKPETLSATGGKYTLLGSRKVFNW